MKDTFFGIVGLLAAFIIPFALLLVFFKGALWLTENALQPSLNFGWMVLAFDLFLVLPASLIRRARPYCAGLLTASSFIFGFCLWLTGFAMTYSIWGGLALTVGLLMFGAGVVPMAMLATLLSGQWAALVMLLVLAVLTFGVRIIATTLEGSTDTQGAIA